MQSRRGWIWRIGFLVAGGVAIVAMYKHDPAMVVLGLIGLALAGSIFGVVRGVRRWRSHQHTHDGTRTN